MARVGPQRHRKKKIYTLDCRNSILRQPAQDCTIFIHYSGNFFRIIHISIIRVSMTQVILFLLLSRASLRTSVTNLTLNHISLPTYLLHGAESFLRS